MREKLIGRVGRIISGSFNSLVSSIENAVPESVMEEAIREIDGAIDEVQSEMGKIIANNHLANKRLMEENRNHKDLSEKIELAVSENRDDLAEAAIAKQLDIELQIPILESTISDFIAQEKELESFLLALKAKKRQMKDELRLYRESKRETDSNIASEDGSQKELSVERKVSKAESAFDRVLERATGVSSSSFREDKKTASQIAELEELARKKSISKRLADIKKKKTGR